MTLVPDIPKSKVCRRYYYYEPERKMSQSRRMNLLKTLSKSDIDEVLDQYGRADQPPFHPLAYGNESEQLQNSNGLNIADAKLIRTDATSLMEEWEKLFCGKNFIQQLKTSAINGNLGTDNFRSICWRVFWECLSENKSDWVEDVNKKRKRYDEIRNKYVIDPYEKEHVNLEIHHPLSQAENSVWHQYFQDNELRDTIMQDLDRLYPEIQFFQQDCVKSIILHILFCYARENPQVQYKQGMHEILAPLIYIMVLNSLVVKESSGNIVDEVKIIMDLTYLEHDAYALFFNIMESIEPWFANLQPLKGNQMTAISKKLTRIQCYMLKRYDMALRDHLEKIEVTPQLYGIRWIRLLFGREFPLNRLLILWDAIFAESIDLVDYIFLSMLINLRGVLLQSDFNNCLRHLMKYPVNTDTKYILKRAVSLKNKVSEAEIIPSAIANHMENNICNINGNGKPVFYSNRTADTSIRPVAETSQRASDNSRRTADTTYEQPHDPQTKTENSGLNSSMRPQRSNSIGKQISSIKNKVGSTPQIISRLSDSLKTKNARQLDPSTVDTLIEDHAHLQKQVSDLQTQLDKMSTISLFCGGKMDLYISLLQQCLMSSETCGELEVHTFAGLKQVRDILKDGLENCGAIPDYEDDFRDIDEHIADASNKLLAESKDETTSSTPSPIPLTIPAISDNISTASCECDDNEKDPNKVTNDNDCTSVDVMYFDHDDFGDKVNCNSEVLGNEKLESNSELLTSSPVGAVKSNEITISDDACNSKETDDTVSPDELDTLIESPLDLDPLNAFQIDLASCIDLSDDFE